MGGLSPETACITCARWRVPRKPSARMPHRNRGSGPSGRASSMADGRNFPRRKGRMSEARAATARARGAERREHHCPRRGREGQPRPALSCAAEAAEQQPASRRHHPAGAARARAARAASAPNRHLPRPRGAARRRARVGVRGDGQPLEGEARKRRARTRRVSRFCLLEPGDRGYCRPV